MPEALAPAAEAEVVDSTPAETTEQTPNKTPAEPAESPETTKTPAPAAEEKTPRAKLEATVREKLDALDAEDDDDEPDAPAKPAASPEADEPAEEAAADVTPAPTLPAAHVRSLKAFGLTDAEIATATPEVAAALHARRNQEITRWAQQGRQANPVQTQTQTQAAPAPVAAPAVKPLVDIAALKQQYGDEPLIAALEAQQQALDRQAAFQNRYEAEIQQRQLEGLGRQIDSFFANKELAPYHKTYGTEGSKLTGEQAVQREKVLQLADAIVGGARREGVNLTLDQALQHAFDSVSAPLAKETARKEITAALKTRTKGITLKPGGRPILKADSRRAMEKSVGAKLKEMFSN